MAPLATEPHKPKLTLWANLGLLYGMDLTLFPFDSQLCKLGIESYGYTADQVRYVWSHGRIKALILHKIRLPDFQIKESFVTSRVESYATGEYSRLYVCFVFSRSAGFCFLQLIIPSTAVVITSWVSLWMENETSFQVSTNTNVLYRSNMSQATTGNVFSAKGFGTEE
ncbi:hypothetical protein COOONC_08165 [Cooperia oncophora]